VAAHTGKTSTAQGLSRRYEKGTLDPEAARFYGACEKSFAVLAIFLFSGALVPLLRLPSGPGVQLPEGDPVLWTMWLGLYGVASLLILVRWRRSIHVATRDKLLLLLIGIAMLSVLWSFAPQITLRREVALIGTSLFGVYLATRYSLDQFLQLLAWALGIAAVLSLIFALMLPSYGITSGAYGSESWQGVFGGGKNVLGRTMALSAVVFMLLALSTRKHRLVLWSGFVLSTGLLWMSNSVTSLISLFAILLLLPLYQALRWRYTLPVSLLILAVVAGGIALTWLLANAEDVLGVLGRDPTLTHRTELWPAVIEMIRQHPWLGYGYGAFWLGWSGESAHVSLWVLESGDPPILHAHNGFLDLWLDLGLLGLATFALGFSLAALRAVSWVRATRTATGLWPLLFLTFIFLYNFTESSILVHNNLFWVLYVAISMLTAARFPESARRTG
jgi:exopolysaccharide production protein ExoQ